MSLEMLKREAAALDEKSQSELLVFLAELREERWAGRLREAGKVLDDPNAKWFTLDEVRAHLKNTPEPADD
jgi:hypothetical protein